MFPQGLWRILIGLWWGLHWIYKLLLVALPFLLCWFSQSMSKGSFSIFWYPPQFLSSKTYSSCQIGLSPPWLELYQDIFCYLWLSWKVKLFWFPFLLLYPLWIRENLLFFFQDDLLPCYITNYVTEFPPNFSLTMREQRWKFTFPTTKVSSYVFFSHIFSHFSDGIMSKWVHWCFIFRG